MSRSWQPAERPRAGEPTYFAAEVLERIPTPLAVFDHAGRLAWANQAFNLSPLREALLDRRHRITHPELERLRVEALRGGATGSRMGPPGVPEDQAAWVDVLPLSSLSGWTVAAARPALAEGSPEPTLPSPRLLLHELRAPLLALDEGLDSLAQLGPDGQLELAGIVSRLSRAAARLRGVLQGIADLVRVDRLGSGGLQVEPVDLREVAADVGDTYSLLAAASGHGLTVETGGGSCTVRGDRELLGRAVGNLVDNAIRHTPPCGITVRVDLRGSLAVVEVADAGPGVPEAERERIFAPFVRLSPPGEAGSGGSGLGLTVVRTIALAHGAGITVESAPQGGALFRLAFLARDLQRHGRPPL